jgi:EcsC protein family
MTDLPVPALIDPTPAIAALAARYRRANGPVMALMTRLGGSVEKQMDALPPSLRGQIERITQAALERAHGVAARGPDMGRQGHVLAVMATGAAGGMGGLPTALAEMPVTVTVILHAIRAAAVEAGYDPDDPGIRAECVQVFGAGSPLAGDDGVNTSLIAARLAVTGSTVQAVIRAVAPRLAAALGQKVIAQAVPVLGAITGAGLNAAYMRYYREIARIRFALLRLAEVHGAEAVLVSFRDQAVPRVTKA